MKRSHVGVVQEWAESCHHSEQNAATLAIRRLVVLEVLKTTCAALLRSIGGD
jgi:hypothetical protein